MTCLTKTKAMLNKVNLLQLGTFFCFKAISTIVYDSTFCKSSLNRIMQTLMSPKLYYFNHVRKQGLYRSTQSRAFLNVKQLGQKYGQQ